MIKVVGYLLLCLFSLIAGSIIAITGPSYFLPNPKESRAIMRDIEAAIAKGEYVISLSPMFSPYISNGKEICLFIDREASEPESGEYAFKKHFLNKDVELGYVDPESYAMTITIENETDIKVFNFRGRSLRHEDKTHFFKFDAKDEHLSNTGCVNFDSAVFVIKTSDRYPKEPSLILAEGEK